MMDVDCRMIYLESQIKINAHWMSSGRNHHHWGNVSIERGLLVNKLLSTIAVGRITSHLIYILLKDSPVNICQPLECFERIFKRVENRELLYFILV